MKDIIKIILCNLIGVIAIIFGCYLYAIHHEFYTILIGVIGLIFVLRAMKLQKQIRIPNKIISAKKKKK
ncbi:MAG: hypothetical protein WCI72_03185 [archaeon]